MIWLVRHFGRSILAIGSIIGVLYLWVDIKGLSDALKEPQEALLEHRETILIWVSFFLAILVISRDLWPFIRQYAGLPDTRPVWRARKPWPGSRLRRLFQRVTFEFVPVLHMNAFGGGSSVGFSVYGIRLQGRNNRPRPVQLTGRVLVEESPIELPLFFHVRGDRRTKGGVARIGPFEEFEAFASLTNPQVGQLVSDNRISDAAFLKDYVPFIVELTVDGRVRNKRFSYARVVSEVDRWRDRVLFYDRGKRA